MHIDVSYRIEADDGELSEEHVKVVKVVAANVGGVLEIALGQRGLAAEVSDFQVSVPQAGSPPQGAEGESAPPAPARGSGPRLVGGTEQG